MESKKKDSALVRSSAAEYLTFVASTGEDKDSIEMRYEDENIWLTQKMMATLYDVGLPTINEHIKKIYADHEQDEAATIRKFRIVQNEGGRQVTRSVNHYNLQMIIAVGFKVNNQRAVRFRVWANQIVEQYTIKGWAMDEERLKNGGTVLTKKYFEEQLERIREIRISERNFYQKLTDIYATSLDYDRNALTTKEFFAMAEGRIDILIGTHKILGKQVKFHDLGLLIIDEEQKFGVAAKEKLTQMSVNVDTLTLTATPIPRTLQFSLMGSRDLSVISTPPPNRQPIITESHLFSEEIIRDAVNAELDRGGQVYFVHNRVEDLMTLQGMVTRLCPRARVGIGHGKMPAEQLEKLIMDFIYGEFDVLISTTIVENGIDIPNANTIIVNNAQNFGLSDLHQLRGRVGRGSQRGYCYLLSPGDELLTPDARRRLRAIEEFSDLGSGFNIAMQDLDIRGAGNLLGAEQSGFIADIGFETYQKIMQEAIAELRSEGLEMPGMSDAEQGVVDKMSYISDSVIEIDVEAELPDSYVQQPAEKLRLYRELDTARNEEMLKSFEAKMIDRFGPLPRPAAELLNVVRLRWEAVRLGMERVKVKNGLMIVHFVGDDDSPYYKSDTFMELLRKVTQRPDRFVLKQHNNRLAMTVRGIKDVAAGYEVLKSL